MSLDDLQIVGEFLFLKCFTTSTTWIHYKTPAILHINVCLQVLENTTACKKKSSIKLFVAPEEAACKLLNWLSVAELHCG